MVRWFGHQRLALLDTVLQPAEVSPQTEIQRAPAKVSARQTARQITQRVAAMMTNQQPHLLGRVLQLGGASTHSTPTCAAARLTGTRANVQVRSLQQLLFAKPKVLGCAHCRSFGPAACGVAAAKRSRCGRRRLAAKTSLDGHFLHRTAAAALHTLAHLSKIKLHQLGVAQTAFPTVLSAGRWILRATLQTQMILRKVWMLSEVQETHCGPAKSSAGQVRVTAGFHPTAPVHGSTAPMHSIISCATEKA